MLRRWKPIHWWILSASAVLATLVSACGLELQAGIGLGLLLLALLPI